MPNFLLEIGTEEIPASYLAPAAEAVAESARAALADARLRCGGAQVLYTPRRITLFITDLPARQDDFAQSVQGPSAKIAFDPSNKPTRAAVGFAKGQGVGVESLEVRQTKSGPYVFANKIIRGKLTAEVLAETLPGMIAGLPFPKSMHWTDPKFTFARPIRSVLALLDADVVKFAVNGVASGRKVCGHPFLAPAAVEIPRADLEDYRNRLRVAFVIVDVEERREMIRREIEALLDAHGSTLDEFELLDEVANLVEFPHAVEGAFPERYLKIAKEIVEAAMMEHQRYFPVRDASGRLLNRFITVSNRPADHDAGIREGNERVLNARLSDAEFFWHEDRKHTLESFASRLSGVTFQAKLGSYADRVKRISDLGVFIADQLTASQVAGRKSQVLENDQTAGSVVLPSTCDLGPLTCDAVRSRVTSAAALCKADLVTQMVGEFPGLQGIVGREYARADGVDAEVAESIAEHYMPKSAGGALPETLTGRILALADKFDTVVGCFAAGLAPTGNQDPYALRRQTQGIVRIVISGELVLSLGKVLAKADSLLPAGLRRASLVDEVTEFVQDRLYYYFLETGVPHDIIRAVLKPGFDDLLDFSRRLESLGALAGTHDWHKLVTAVERTHNITRDFTPTRDVDETRLAADEEKELYRLYRDSRDRIASLIAEHNYPEVCDLYESTFAVPLHVFFEKVFVNVEDEEVRANRLTLLKQINRLFADRVADLSQILIDQR
jgi:glycyl-tRNA synthetase beta chain